MKPYAQAAAGRQREVEHALCELRRLTQAQQAHLAAARAAVVCSCATFLRGVLTPADGERLLSLQPFGSSELGVASPGGD